MSLKPHRYQPRTMSTELWELQSHATRPKITAEPHQSSNGERPYGRLDYLWKWTSLYSQVTQR